jgi:DHA2 family multidrug resistance protein
VDHFSWPYIFYINIPLGIIATLLTLSFVVQNTEKKIETNQVIGLESFFGISFIGSLQFVLEHGQRTFNNNLFYKVSFHYLD